MLLAAPTGSRMQHIVVWAYDIACPRRARAVRSVLFPLHNARQFSVIETSLDDFVFRGILAEVTSSMDEFADRLAVWWPTPALRIAADARGLVSVPLAGCRDGSWGNCGNFLVCYDISDDERRERVAGAIASIGSRLQRSVYWLRLPSQAMLQMLTRARESLAENDRIWVYPIRGFDRLWRIGATDSSLFPVTTHCWQVPAGFRP